METRKFPDIKGCRLFISSGGAVSINIYTIALNVIYLQKDTCLATSLLAAYIAMPVSNKYMLRGIVDHGGVSDISNRSSSRLTPGTQGSIILAKSKFARS